MQIINGKKLKRIVRCYRLKRNKCCDDEIECYTMPSHIDDVIKKAALGFTKSKKMHDHQHRIGKQKLLRFAGKLSENINKIKYCKTFESLMDVVNQCKTERIGELAIYDTSFRIGIFLGIYPDKVYLHRGTREGAKNLLGKHKIRGKSYLHKHELPSELQVLQPWELENFFCIMKDKLR